MTDDGNKKYFVDNLSVNVFKRAFKSLQNAFIPSYIAKFLCFILIGLLSYGAYQILFNLWKDIQPPTDPNDIPYNLIYITIGVVFVFVFLSYLLNTMSNSITYHSFGKSLTGEVAGLSSFKYSAKKIGHWLLITFLVLVGSIFYFAIAGLLAYKLGEPGIIAAVVMGIVYLIALIVLYPIFSIVMPIMVLEKRNVFEAMGRAFIVGFPNYWKIVGIVLLNNAVVYIIVNVFVVLFFFFQQGLDLSLGFFSVTQTMTSLTAFWVMLAVFISVKSMVSVLYSSLITSLSASIIGRESSPESAYERIVRSLD